jgi:hypothetical protein
MPVFLTEVRSFGLEIQCSPDRPFGFIGVGTAVDAQNIGVGPCQGRACGDMFEAMARIAPSNPNEATGRIYPIGALPGGGVWRHA